jgi:hypothetical protein
MSWTQWVTELTELPTRFSFPERSLTYYGERKRSKFSTDLNLLPSNFSYLFTMQLISIVIYYSVQV